MGMARVVALLLMLLLPAEAAATTLSITSPHVTKGRNILEYRTGIDMADEENLQSIHEYLHIESGLSSRWALRLSGAGRKHGADALEFRAAQAQARFQLVTQETAGWDGAIRVSYQKADGDDAPDSAGFALLAQHEADAFTLVYNAVFSHEVGTAHQGGVELDLGWQVSARLPETEYRLGLEGFHALGRLGEMEGFERQEHRIGPVLRGPLSDAVSFQIGYLQGVSDTAPDQAVKLFLSYRF